MAPIPVRQMVTLYLRRELGSEFYYDYTDQSHCQMILVGWLKYQYLLAWAHGE